MDIKDKKLTVIGDVDSVDVVAKVRKHWPNAEIVGPAKEEKKAPQDTKPKEKGESGKIETFLHCTKAMAVFLLDIVTAVCVV